jgi:hypothetical protein
MVFKIFSELIDQFQQPDLPPKNKLYRYISDFKDSALFNIYSYSTDFLIGVLNKIEFEDFNCHLIYFSAIANCINESLEYEEDLNAKDENYKKFEIKPFYIPNNNKRKSRDKSLDIETLLIIISRLLEHNKIFSKLQKNDSNQQCLTLLQKYCTMKLFYLGDNKLKFLQYLIIGIDEIILTKIGIIDEKCLEEFCKLIFLLKKNFNFIELLQNLQFIDNIFKFTIECINNCKYP